RTVHIPDPGVVHFDLEVHLAVGVANVQVDLVGQVEPALRLDHVGELADNVAVLPVKLELHLGFVLLEILGAHPGPPSLATVPRNCAATYALRPGATPPVPLRRLDRATAATFTYEKRCSTQGPCRFSAAWCSGVTYPLCSSKPYVGQSLCRSVMIRSRVT